MKKNALSNNKILALIFKGISHILFNQKQIMEHLKIENSYAVRDTEELSVLFSELSEAYNTDKNGE